MEPQELQAKRIWIGLLALIFGIAAGAVFVQSPEKTAIIGSLIRVGLMLAAFWLAIPTMIKHPKILKRLPWYLLMGAVATVAFIRYAILLIPLLIVLGILTMMSRTPRVPNKSGSSGKPPDG